jgi:two-component system response regulator NreC
VVRQGLRVLLEKEPDFDIVGEASNGVEALRCIEKLRPAVAIVDLAMPQLNGLEVTREITHRRLPSRVLLLSAHSNEQYVLTALKNGAFGYVLKSSAVDELVRAIRHVHLGMRYLPPAYSEAAVDAYLEKAEKSAGNGSDLLTRRERQILQMVAEGSSNAEIGSRLFISTRTVEVHRFNLMRKLSLHNSAELIRYALEHLPPETESTRKT